VGLLAYLQNWLAKQHITNKADTYLVDHASLASRSVLIGSSVLESGSVILLRDHVPSSLCFHHIFCAFIFFEFVGPESWAATLAIRTIRVSASAGRLRTLATSVTSLVTSAPSVALLRLVTLDDVGKGHVLWIV
jgi:hypothetical protein